jgi:hypothetical protein
MTHHDEAIVFVTVFTAGACMLLAGVVVLSIAVLT